MKSQLTKIFTFILFLVIIAMMTSCSESNFMSNVYTGTLDDGTEIELYNFDTSQADETILDKYKTFTYPTLDGSEITNTTIAVIEFNFYSDIANEEVTLNLKWKYYTSVFNWEKTVDLTSYTFTTTGERQFLSVELPNDDYFVIKNDKVQYLIIEASYESEYLNIIIDVPDFFAVSDDNADLYDEDDFEHEFDDEGE